MSEASPEDVVEQQADAQDVPPAPLLDVPLEADPADALEQSAVVDLDEDDRR